MVSKSDEQKISISGWFFSAVFLWAVFQFVSFVYAPNGKIRYEGGVAKITSIDSSQNRRIDEEGLEMPYGMYRLPLKNGKVLIIHKNNKGNVSIAEKGDLVVVRAGENVIEVSYEKE